MQARDEEAPIYDRQFSGYWYFAEVLPVTKELRSKRDDFILDLGSGTGRITVELVKQGCSVLAIDFSKESLGILKTRCLNKADAVQADMSFLPLNACSFKKIVSCQAFQDLPTEDTRIRAIREISRVLEPKGTLVLTVPNWGIKQMILRSQVEGYYDQRKRLFRHFFSFPELRTLLTNFAGLRLVKLMGIMTVPTFIERKAGRFSVYMERFFSRLPLSGSIAHLILASAVKTSPGYEA